MRTAYLPDEQERWNDGLHRSLRTQRLLQVTLLLVAIGIFAALIARGPVVMTAELPKIIGPDGSSVTGVAVVIKEHLLLAEGDVAEGSQVSFREGEKTAITKVRAEQFTDNAKFTLLRLQTAAPPDLLPSMGAAESGQKASSTSPAGGWEGTLMEKKVGDYAVFEPQPSFTAGNGAPVTSGNEKILIGISCPSNAGTVVVSMREFLAKFPELNN